MPAIKRIRSLKGVGILADKTPKDTGPDFLKVNLIYGFNGSGKSTLSRVFACLQIGQRHLELPDGCQFAIELDDGSVYSTPDSLQGLENTVCVFNSDFVTRNLQWEKGTASSIFHLSQEQGELIEQLRAAETALPTKRAVLAGAEKTAKASEKAFATYCTERAKVIHGARHLGTRKYEAPKLKADYATEKFDKSSLIDTGELAALQDVVTRTAPPPSIPSIEVNTAEIRWVVDQAERLSQMSLGAVVLDELHQHPTMVSWIKDGHQYHTEQSLTTCLLCAGELSDARKAALSAALGDKIEALMADVAIAEKRARALPMSSGLDPRTFPKSTELEPSLEARYTAQINEYGAAVEGIQSLLAEVMAVLSARREKPTEIVSIHCLSSVVNERLDNLVASLDGVNQLISEHNLAVKEFSKRQEEASGAILRHYLAEGLEQYSSGKNAAEADVAAKASASAEVEEIEKSISTLKEKVRTHGPAASRITKLVHAYLGHKELTIVAGDKGYSLCRNGKPVKGQPSEGEKTAIALCYFITTLEAEGRQLKNLIVVVDDPISSLDTKAMNYACALLLRHLEKAKQIFVLTHNQHCMNEFKKAWKPLTEPRNSKTEATGRLLFMDVQVPDGSSTRRSQIVEMSPLLRHYDSEYHFLCHELLKFEGSGTDHASNLLLIPNAMRRVLEIFLAFKVPGNGPIKDKLTKLCESHKDLDPVRMVALERLSQVESHSDSLDDLTGHSPMIIEEVRETCHALLELMAIADPPHTAAIRRQCKA